MTCDFMSACVHERALWCGPVNSPLQRKNAHTGYCRPRKDPRRFSRFIFAFVDRTRANSTQRVKETAMERLDDLPADKGEPNFSSAIPPIDGIKVEIVRLSCVSR